MECIKEYTMGLQKVDKQKYKVALNTGILWLSLVMYVSVLVDVYRHFYFILLLLYVLEANVLLFTSLNAFDLPNECILNEFTLPVIIQTDN